MQESYVRALERDDEPDDPEAWLLRVAHNLLADTLRRDRRLEPLDVDPETSVDPVDPGRVDDELAVVFMCCHPSLPRAAQIALTLRLAFGFPTEAIARALASEEKAIAQRIVRAKQRLRDESIAIELPEASEIPARVDSILDVLHQLFAEGHGTASTDACGEALRLIRLITRDARTATPAADALHALFAFQFARMPARTSSDGGRLLLHEQDRGLWNRALLDEAFVLLGRAARGERPSRFHLEAGIAACHASAVSHETTDWTEIAALYDDLRAVAPSPILDVSRAFAIAMRDGAQAGLDALDAIPERDFLARYPYALATYAELHASRGELDVARAYLERALTAQSRPEERALLERKLAALAR